MRTSRSRLTANYDLTVATFLLLLCCFILLNSHIDISGRQIGPRLRQAVAGFTHQSRADLPDPLATFGLVRDISCADCLAYRRWQGKLALFEEGSPALSEAGQHFISALSHLPHGRAATLTLDWPISRSTELDGARVAVLGALLATVPARLHLGVADRPFLTLELAGDAA